MYRFILFSSFLCVLHISLQVRVGVLDQQLDEWKNDPLCFPNYSVFYFPVQGDCSQYYRCNLGDKTLWQCDSGKWFNPNKTACDTPGSYCNGTIPTTRSTTPTTPTTTKTTPTTPTTTKTTPTTPTTTKTTPTTPTTTRTTPTTPTTKTTTPTTTRTTPTTPTTRTTITTTIRTTTQNGPPTEPHVDPRCIDGKTTYWPHPALCSRYIECYKKNSYEMSCPPKLYFSDLKKECVNADESECCQTSVCQ